MPFDLAATLARYDANDLTLCSIGSHSALEVASGARLHGLRNLIVTERGRNRTYDEFFARREDGPPRGCVDATLQLEKFADVLDDDVQARLLRENVVFVANRSFEVYLHQRYSYAQIEERMAVPFFGNRRLLRAEERDEPENQYALMDRAGIQSVISGEPGFIRAASKLILPGVGHFPHREDPDRAAAEIAGFFTRLGA